MTLPLSPPSSATTAAGSTTTAASTTAAVSSTITTSPASLLPKRKATEALTNPLSSAKKPKANASITSFFGPPKTISKTISATTKPSETSTSTSQTTGVEKAVHPLPAPVVAEPFNKNKWVDGLTGEQRELLQLEIETLHESWLAVLNEEIVSREFLELKRFLKREVEAGKVVYPPLEDVYSWSRHTPLPTVKAVILGQDPYHNANQAHGLCFSVRPPTPAPPSLKNIYIALKNDFPTFRPPPAKSGLLTPWADRGVLLLNTCLTVRAHEANSHANRGWEKFTQAVIDIVAKERREGVVFLAWGTPAGKRVGRVGVLGRGRHLVLKSVHPSPLSASRGFFECGHFKAANAWLVGRYGVGGGIDWDLGGESGGA